MTPLASTARVVKSTGGKGFFCSIPPASIRLFMPRDTASQNAIHGNAPTTRKVPTACVGAPLPSRMENTTSKTR